MSLPVAVTALLAILAAMFATIKHQQLLAAPVLRALGRIWNGLTLMLPSFLNWGNTCRFQAQVLLLQAALLRMTAFVYD